MRAAVIVLAHGPEPALAECVRAAGPEALEVIVVDNDAAPGSIAQIRRLGRVAILEPATNLGFAGGCYYAAEHARGVIRVFLNVDAVGRPGAIDPPTGLGPGVPGPVSRCLARYWDWVEVRL